MRELLLLELLVLVIKTGGYIFAVGKTAHNGKLGRGNRVMGRGDGMKRCSEPSRAGGEALPTC